MRTLFTILLLCFIVSASFTSMGQIADPPSIPVYIAAGAITVDGMLNEPTWAIPTWHLKYKIGGTPSGTSHTPTGFAVVKEPYKDTSTCYVRFLRSGTNLYISLDSDDKQVCRFGDSWEGDGLFMKIKNSSGSDIEFKLYYNLGGTNPDIHYEGPAYGSGAGYKKPGTIVNDSTNVDAGYSAELLIDITGLGFTSATDSLNVLINIFDPDNYNDLVPAWGPNGNYAKQWWGSEWGPDMRKLNLLNVTVPVELISFTGYYRGSSAYLQWSTATETNNRGFEVERSVNNSDFNTVAFIEGQGTTTSTQNYAFTDNSLVPNTVYSYRLKQIDFNGRFHYSNVVELGATNPVEYALGQNYPNPFNPSTHLSFSLPFKSNVTLDIYNLIGQKVLTLISGNLEAGTHEVNINASNLNSGIYIYTLNATGENGSVYSSSRKMTLLK